MHFLDVGQSDAAFVELGDDLCMLVDASDGEHAEKVRDYIKALGYSRIDTLLLTHPHADHTGGAETVLESFDVGRIMTPEASYTTPELDAVKAKASETGTELLYVGAGDGFDFGECKAVFLSGGGRYEDENDQSAVMKLSYKSRAFLFMADATAVLEKDIIKTGADLTADVVKVGHHGSDSSSSDELVEAVGAEYAVISCSENNEYSHPSPYSVARYQTGGAAVLPTDEYSDIVFETDGYSMSVKNKNNMEIFYPLKDSAESTVYLWGLDSENHTVHKRGCKHISGKYIEYTNAELRKITAEGYSCCEICFAK